MDFKVRKIRKKKRAFGLSLGRSLKTTALKIVDRNNPPKRRLSLPVFTIIFTLALIATVTFGAYHSIKNINFASLIFSFGKTLQTDETGKTNILLLGTGNEEHDGANLTDTIIIASIDYENKIVPMLSIPRDLYIENDTIPGMRINSAYDYLQRRYGTHEALAIFQNMITEITGIPIHYNVKVNFNGFVDIVDSLGGVEILVEESIYDPYYPKGETIYYETFEIKEGLQTIDGETALKYARSRKTTSDFDRAKRQQQLLFAIKEKALSLNLLTNAGKITSLYKSIEKSITTTLSLAEIIELAKIAKNFGKENIFPLVLNDDFVNCGGILYSPVRDYFDGMAVLLPAGEGTDYIKDFVEVTFDNIKTIALNEEIQVLNGTKTPGLAGETMDILNRFCFNVIYYSNASERSLPESTIYYTPIFEESDNDRKDSINEEGKMPKTVELLTQLLPIKTQAGIPPEYLNSEKRQQSKIVIELGEDYLPIRLNDAFDSLKYMVPVTPPTIEEDFTTTIPEAKNTEQ